jgi:cell wall-associated NlpC family hydrolase
LRAKALALTSMLVFGFAGSALAETQAAPGGDPAPTATSTSAKEQAAASGGAQYGATTGAQSSAPARPVVNGFKAKLLRNGTAAAPSMAPAEVQRAIWAANRLIGKPYIYGGGHGRFEDKGYDCSGTVSYALHGGSAKLLRTPLDSGSFMRWGDAGKGSWMTIYTNPGHAFIVIAGLRLDTSAAGDPTGARGPRWRPNLRSTGDFVARHPAGF